MESKVWLITGASKGFGKIWATAALNQGHKVAATARNINDLADLTDQFGSAVLPLKLDVNDREACFTAVEKVVDHFGRIDVLVNNAGFGHFGFVEEISEQAAREQIETNLFGSLWMIQAAIPHLRQQNSGHILQVSSIGGVVAFPSLGIYHASKWAVEGLCEALSQEVAMFNVKVTLIEPAGYATDWGGASAKFSQPNEVYQPIRAVMMANAGKLPIGDPHHTAEAILKVVAAENPPLRLFLGQMPYHVVMPVYEQRTALWNEWKSVAENAQ